jgi:mRNA interferase RelE/StbE
MYQVVINKKAQKEIDALPSYIKGSVDEHILALGANPRPQGCIKLKGGDNLYRIRIGEYRVVYAIEDEIRIIEIVKVAHRRDVYD